VEKGSEALYGSGELGTQSGSRALAVLGHGSRSVNDLRHGSEGIGLGPRHWFRFAGGRACQWLLRRAAELQSVTLGASLCSCLRSPQSSWGHIIVSAGYDKTLRVWLPDAAECHHKLVGTTAPVLVLSVAAACGTLLAASGDREGVARTWDCARRTAARGDAWA